MIRQSKGSIQTGPFGSQLHAADYVEIGIPSVMPKNISIEGIVEQDIARITQEDADRLKKYLLEEGDIIYSRRGDVEKCALVKQHETGWLCGTGCLRVRLGNESHVTPEFLHAYLSTPAIREWVSRNAIGATMPNLNTTILSDIPVILPNSSSIQLIGNIWHEINQKISLNRQINQTLEHMAQTMFKSWFVDFDPVIDNALDAGNEIPEPLQARAELRQKVRASQDFQPLPAEVRALFPAEFEESELGWMPKGWEVQALFDLAEFINGAAYKAFNPNTIKMGKPIIKIAELKSGITESTAYSDIDMPSKYLLQDSDILFSWSGNPDTSIDTFVWSLGEAWLNQHIFKVVPKNIKHRSYVLMTLKYLKPTFTAIARDKQTTGLGHVTVKDLKELLLPIPASVTIETTGNLFNSYLDQIFGLTKQIQNLISLRDALLPKLISGELALDDLPADVAEAAEAV